MKLPNGYGQVIKLAGKRRRPYAVRVDDGSEQRPDGSFVRKVKYLAYFATKKEAFDFLAKYNSDILPGAETPAPEPSETFSTVYKKFIDSYQAKNPDASDSALKSYRTAYDKARRLYAKKFALIRADDLQSVIAEHSTLSKSSINNIIKLFHGMYRYAIQHDIAEKDYSGFIFPQFSKKETPSHMPFSAREIKELCRLNCEVPLILIYTGMRVGELCSLEVANIDLDNGFLTGGSKTAAGKNRTIPIHPCIKPFIEKAAKNSKRFFLSGNGWKLSRDKLVSLYWKPAMDKAGFPSHTPHDARHTAATLMERYGLPMLHRKLILGHAVQDITQGIYTHVTADELAKSIRLIPPPDEL